MSSVREEKREARAGKSAGLLAAIIGATLLAGASTAAAQDECDIVFSVTNATYLRGLQLEVDYAAAPGDFATTVVCDVAPAGTDETFNDQNTQKLSIGWVDTTGFTGPLSPFATCTFIGTTGTPTSGQFLVTVLDSTGVSDPPTQASPTPTIGVAVTGCSPAVVSCGNGVRQTGEECDDGNLVLGDGCSTECLDTASCAATPETGCITGESGKLSFKNNSEDDAKDQGQFQVKKGGAAGGSEFGDPTVAGNTVGWCVYDNGALIAGQDVPTGTGWATSGSTGFQFKGDAEGVAQIKVKGGDAGKSQVSLKAKSKAGAFQSPPLQLDQPVLSQLVFGETGSCFERSFAVADKNTETQYSAK